MKWQDKLTKKELKHLRENGILTLSGMERNAEAQAKMRREEDSPEPCFECWSISQKLGFDV